MRRKWLKLLGSVVMATIVGWTATFFTQSVDEIHAHPISIPKHLTSSMGTGFVFVPRRPIHGDPPRHFTNGIGMKFAWIPPGKFLMGSPVKEEGRNASEIQREVTLTTGFYMGVYTITQEEWRKVMGNNPSTYRGEMNLPVESVEWEDCQQFIKKLREMDNTPYRLPTEAEWEYACRAGSTTPFYFGESISAEQANYNYKYTYGRGKKGLWRVRTTPVGSFPPNAWGLYDMHGNVWQWCQDWYGDYSTKDLIDPTGPKTGKNRVLRGGSWATIPEACRSGDHAWFEPGDGATGFRVCFSYDQ